MMRAGWNLSGNIFESHMSQTPFLQLRMVMIRSCCFSLAGNRHLVQIKRRMDGANELLQSAEKLEPERKSFAVMNTTSFFYWSGSDMKDKYPAFKYQIQSNGECVVQLVLLISEIFHSHKKIWSQNNTK